MKKGTVLLNTEALANDPFRMSIFMGRYKNHKNDTMKLLVLDSGRPTIIREEIKKLCTTLIPVGYVDIMEEVKGIMLKAFEKAEADLPKQAKEQIA